MRWKKTRHRKEPPLASAAHQLCPQLGRHVQKENLNRPLHPDNLVRYLFLYWLLRMVERTRARVEIEYEDENDAVKH